MDDNCSADHGQHAAGKKLGQEIDEETCPPQSSPPHLAIPDLAGLTPAERLRQRSVHQTHREPGAANNLGRRRIFGDFPTEGLDSTGALEICAPPQHGLALCEALIESVHDILPARLI